MHLTQPIHVAQTEDERRAIYTFRYRIYIEEMGKPYRHADHKNRMLRDPLDDEATLLYSTRNGEITGTLRINWGEDISALTSFAESCALAHFRPFPADSLSFCSRLMVDKARRSSAVAAALSTAAYLTGRERSIQLNFSHCAPRLLSFFERMGFRQYTRPFHHSEVGPQVPLVLVLEDIEHLRVSRSPFLDRALERSNSNHAATWFLNQFSGIQPNNLINEETTRSYEFDRLCTATSSV
jgi:predicted GNAT family N-acyltransferase